MTVAAQGNSTGLHSSTYATSDYNDSASLTAPIPNTVTGDGASTVNATTLASITRLATSIESTWTSVLTSPVSMSHFSSQAEDKFVTSGSTETTSLLRVDKLSTTASAVQRSSKTSSGSKRAKVDDSTPLVRTHTRSRWMQPVSTITAILGMFGIIMLIVLCNVCVSDKKAEERYMACREDDDVESVCTNTVDSISEQPDSPTTLKNVITQV